MIEEVKDEILDRLSKPGNEELAKHVLRLLRDSDRTLYGQVVLKAAFKAGKFYRASHGLESDFTAGEDCLDAG